MTFFVVTGLDRGKVLSIQGEFIADGTVTYDSSHPSSGSKPKPKVKLPVPFEVKWVLPPKSSGVYGSVKAFAESMGYETVELDDFSYPPPRI